MKISMDKKYRTRNGRAVRVLCVDRKCDEFPVVAAVLSSDGKETIHTFTAEGKYALGDHKTPTDLVEVSEWDDFKIDDLVMVRNTDDGAWNLRHFAGVDSKCDRPSTWVDGTTSWTANRSKSIWIYCRKPTEEELQGILR